MERRKANEARLEEGVLIRSVHQEVYIVALCEDKDGKEFELVLDSSRRPIPVPYSEEP